jgi:hypothetical protein
MRVSDSLLASKQKEEAEKRAFKGEKRNYKGSRFEFEPARGFVYTAIEVPEILGFSHLDRITGFTG